MSTSTDARGRRAFGPTVLLGVAAATAAAVAASKPLVSANRLTGDRFDALGEVPLASAVAVVPLICWALLLALPGKWRRLPAAVGVLAALGTVLAADQGLGPAREDLGQAVVSLGGDSIVTADTGWFWTLVVASMIAALMFAVALRHAHLWPGMSRRFDAPGAQPTEEEPTTNRDLWKAMDEGRDPTTQLRPDEP